MSHVPAAATALAAVAAAAAVAAPAVGAPARFTGNVCGLLKAADVKTVEVTAACKPVKTASLPSATIYGGVWSDGPSVQDNRLSVQVWAPKYAAFAATFKQESQGIPVKIGLFGRADITNNGENLYILVKGFGLLINLNHWSDSRASNIGEIGPPMAAIAKKIAAQVG